MIHAIFSQENVRFALCAVFGAAISYVGLWHEVNSQGDKIKTQASVNIETKESLKDISEDILEIKLILAKKFGE